ncbi:MAG: helicase HerA domain-containing protein [Candidatus Odinarchaeia archaeon]
MSNNDFLDNLGEKVGKLAGGDAESLILITKNEDICLGELFLIPSFRGGVRVFVFRVLSAENVLRNPVDISRLAGTLLVEDGSAKLFNMEREQLLGVAGKLLGYAEKQGNSWVFKPPKRLPEHLADVYRPIPGRTDKILMEILKSQVSGDLFIGTLQAGEVTLNVPVNIPIEYLPMHMGIFGTTGSGKSVSHDSLVVWRDADNLVKVTTIHQLYESMASKNQNIVIKNDDDEQVISLLENIEILSLDEKLTPLWKRPTFISRHKSSNMFKIKTETGKEISVTGDHSLLVVRNGRIQVLRSEDIIPDIDYLLAPQIPSPKNVSHRAGEEKDVHLIYSHHLTSPLNKRKYSEVAQTDFLTQLLNSSDDVLLSRLPQYLQTEGKIMNGNKLQVHTKHKINAYLLSFILARLGLLSIIKTKKVIGDTYYILEIYADSARAHLKKHIMVIRQPKGKYSSNNNTKERFKRAVNFIVQRNFNAPKETHKQTSTSEVTFQYDAILHQASGKGLHIMLSECKFITNIKL